MSSVFTYYFLGELPTFLKDLWMNIWSAGTKVLKRPSPRSENISSAKSCNTDDTKNKATILASWLMEKRNESTFLNLVEEKPAEGYQISIFPVWALFDKQVSTMENQTRVRNLFYHDANSLLYTFSHVLTPASKFACHGAI